MPATLDGLVELLFKYRPVVFEHGTLALGTPGDLRPFVLLLGGIALLAARALLTRRVRGRPADRAVLGVLRVVAVALLVLCLLQPQVVVAAAATRDNVVAVLVDESRSMRIPDADGRTRAAVVRELLERENGLMAALSSRFRLRLYGFGAEARRVGSAAELRFDAPRTSMAEALESVSAELDGQQLAGVVLVSDGGDAEGGELARVLGTLRARRVPVFTILAGGEPARDVTVASVDVPRRAVRGSAADARVTLAHRGLAGREVRVVAEDEGRVVATREVTLPRAGRVAVTLPVPLLEEGPRRLRFRVTPVRDDQVPDNDERLAVVQVDATPRRILYFEGEPRPEAKFIRQAVAGDRELEVVLLQRTADEKYLRLGVRDSLEVATGFPQSRDELFAYDAIILGSVEASAFSFEQLRMIEDFVNARGGGLLLLGGRRGLGEGGYARTPLAALSPLALPDEPAAERLDTLAPRLTREGREHPALRLGASPEAAAERWRTLPAVTVVNRVGEPKPGAVTLLAGAPGDRPLLAYQRFGRGRTALLLPQDSWIWQMHADVPLDDQSHETFWRQLLRWLAGESPGRLTSTVAREVVERGEAVRLQAEPRDARHAPLADALVLATLTSPSGVVRELHLPAASGAGRFAGFAEPDEEGLWRVTVTADAPDGVQGDAMAFAVERSRDEFYDVTARRETLARVAAATRGRAYDLRTVDALPREIVYAASGATTQERKDLWDAPAMLLALLGVLGAEWGYRRWRGLA